MKKLKSIMIVGAIMMMMSSNLMAQGIEFFHGTFAEAQVKAKEEGKLIFIDFYTSWCGPCKMMAKKYFTLETVGKQFNKKFICLKIDAEKEDGPELAKKYEVKGYPTLVFTDASGKVVNRVLGMKNEEQLLELSK